MLNSPWAQGITSKVSSRPDYIPTTADRAATYAACSSHSLETLPKEHHLGAHDLERLDRMATVTATDRVSLIKAAKHYPPLIHMSVDAAVARMLLMKQLLPGAACLAHVIKHLILSSGMCTSLAAVPPNPKMWSTLCKIEWQGEMAVIGRCCMS